MHKDGEPQHFFKSSKEKSVHRHEKAKDKALSKKIGTSFPIVKSLPDGYTGAKRQISKGKDKGSYMIFD